MEMGRLARRHESILTKREEEIGRSDQRPDQAAQPPAGRLEETWVERPSAAVKFAPGWLPDQLPVTTARASSCLANSDGCIAPASRSRRAK